ncbi:hypothetical protein AC578_10833 [Pseudocercospora eumusae]|uniref:Uncharacterized protein n=1 Tax=Pseudocercospora eumusae TaxID=321146 RepID=A0A139H8U7_9PEZI|nr:hypothetical protein AC578_10833 [Pseudocercospora eumusae]
MYRTMSTIAVPRETSITSMRRHDAGNSRVVSSFSVANAASDEAAAKHEKDVDKHGAENAGLDKSELIFLKGNDRDDEFNGIAESGVEETTDGRSNSLGELFSRERKEGCKRNNGCKVENKSGDWWPAYCSRGDAQWNCDQEQVDVIVAQHRPYSAQYMARRESCQKAFRAIVLAIGIVVVLIRFSPSVLARVADMIKKCCSLIAADAFGCLLSASDIVTTLADLGGSCSMCEHDSSMTDESTYTFCQCNAMQYFRCEAVRGACRAWRAVEKIHVLFNVVEEAGAQLTLNDRIEAYAEPRSEEDLGLLALQDVTTIDKLFCSVFEATSNPSALLPATTHRCHHRDIVDLAALNRQTLFDSFLHERACCEGILCNLPCA